MPDQASFPGPPAPAVSVEDLTDPTAVGGGVEVLDQDIISLDKNPILFKRITVRLENSVLLYQWTSNRVRSRLKLDSEMMALTVIGARARGTIDGMLLTPEMLLVAAPGVAVDLVVDAGYSSVALLIPPDDLFAQLATRGRKSEVHLPDRFDLLMGTKTRPYFKLGKRLAQNAKRRHRLFDNSREIRIAAYNEVLETVFAMLGTEAPDIKPASGDRRRQNFSQIVKTIEDHLLANLVNRPTIPDFYRISGVSERTLQYAFNEILGMTPVAYLNLLRLHRARFELRANSRKSTTVSDVAMKWGFWHFGDFSRSYEDCFQESPSETLKGSGLPIREGQLRLLGLANK
jgi:AraC family ethanolamine operon transcriptional activator